jgi:hypothetical protein
MFLGVPYRPVIGAAPTVWANGFARRQTARAPVNALGSIVAGYPFVLYISRTHTQLRTVANGGMVQSSQGWDIRYEIQGVGKLAHDLDNYATSSGFVGSFVRFPSIDPSADVILHLYYGKTVTAPEADPTACWAEMLASIDLATGTDWSNSGADLTLSGVTPTTFLGIRAGNFTAA